SYGVFGKLPAKRDFVAIDLPSSVLRPWETWLQGVIAETRQSLGTDWTAVFLKAPIWRFWCGSSVLGTSLIGAL
ncbi:type VI secretion system-associated protein TagF, partial [Acinetobacter baumannii]|uniref:type VI secretion system-associated protein TagF n=1 Tax=Acinetobacter baumannii TaxID=470 RepID=UPI0013D5E087